MEKLRVFVLGDMKPEGDVDRNDTRFVRQTHTSQLTKIIEGAAVYLAAEGAIPAADHIEVNAPEESLAANIVGAVLSEIENSDLVVVDISTESPSVIYELGAVNALGIPYILVSSNPPLPFYLTQVRAILGFAFKGEFDPDEASHLDLRIRLLRNYNSPDGREASESRFTEYFGGLPIVNVSGPVAIATGYQANFLNRFGAPDAGILSRKVRWATSTKNGSWIQSLLNLFWSFTRGAAGGISVVAEVRPQHLLVIVPDPSLYTDWPQARAAIEASLTASGYPVQSVSVLEEDGEQRRLGMGVMILQDYPEIVLDIPRTLFPLMQSPRVLAALRGQTADRTSVRSRMSRRLLNDFRASIDWSLEQGRNGAGADGAWDRIHVIAENEVEAKIAELLGE